MQFAFRVSDTIGIFVAGMISNPAICIMSQISEDTLSRCGARTAFGVFDPRISIVRILKATCTTGTLLIAEKRDRTVAIVALRCDTHTHTHASCSLTCARSLRLAARIGAHSRLRSAVFTAKAKESESVTRGTLT